MHRPRVHEDQGWARWRKFIFEDPVGAIPSQGRGLFSFLSFPRHRVLNRDARYLYDPPHSAFFSLPLTPLPTFISHLKSCIMLMHTYAFYSPTTFFLGHDWLMGRLLCDFWRESLKEEMQFVRPCRLPDSYRHTRYNVHRPSNKLSPCGVTGGGFFF